MARGRTTAGLFQVRILVTGVQEIVSLIDDHNIDEEQVVRWCSSAFRRRFQSSVAHHSIMADERVIVLSQVSTKSIVAVLRDMGEQKCSPVVVINGIDEDDAPCATLLSLIWILARCHYVQLMAGSSTQTPWQTPVNK